MKHYVIGSFSYWTEEEPNIAEIRNKIEALFPEEDLTLHVDAEKESYELRIEPDEPFESPRDLDNVGTMMCAHNRYNLGDEQFNGDMREALINILDDQCGTNLDDEFYEVEDEQTPEAHEAYVDRRVEEEVGKHLIIADLYLYDHSGITISMSPFSCPWDSGQVGFIYVTRERAKQELGVSDEDFPLEQQILENRLRGESQFITKTFESLDSLVTDTVFRNEVDVYDAYLRGDVWSFYIYGADGEVEDSCCGFYGDDWKSNGLADHANHMKDQISSIKVFGHGGEELEELDWAEVFNTNKHQQGVQQ